MGETCILNVSSISLPFLEYLKSKGKISEISPWREYLCFEFEGEIEISIDDYIRSHPRRQDFLRYMKYESFGTVERDVFNKNILLPMIKHLSGGEVVEYVPGEKIRLRDTEKTEYIGLRISKEEKKILEKVSEKLGVSISEFVRMVIREKIQSILREEKEGEEK